MLNLFQKLQSALSLDAPETGDIQAHRPLSPKMEAFLAKHNPVLLEQYNLKVLASIDKVIQEQQKLQDIQAQAQPFIHEYTAEQARVSAELQTYTLEAPSTQLPKSFRPTKPKVDQRVVLLVNAGLSSMMAFAILHYFNIRITRLKSGQELLFMLAIIMAISITVATKQAITIWVIRTRSGETERSFPQNIAFWERLQTGDTLSYVSIIIPIMEMLFAGPGLMELLPSSLASNLFYQISAFVVAGLTATINIFLAWSQGLEKIQELRQRQAQWVEYQANKADYEQAKHDRDTNPNYLRCLQRFKELQALIAQYQEEIATQARIVQVQFERTRAEGQQWWDSFERWGKRHHRLLESL
jgi:hypothetical protein